MRNARFGWLFSAGLGLLLLLAPGCVEPPAAARIVGPDGTRMLHVHCPSEQAACFRIAGESCPHGYDLSPIFDPRDGNFLVRCRAPQAAPAIVIARAPAPPPNSASAAVVSDWPPAEVARPAEPWPTQASSELPPTPRTQSGKIDLGY
ncbi:MAG TPA: hypothetical protein VFK05_18685 [Polyangiaceae bacterium]|nr:hypothetical protein [Polyangiaceae bacterium]